MNVKQIESYPYELVQHDPDYVLDLIGQKDNYDHLFVKYGNGEILSVYGCNGMPYLDKYIDLIYIHEPKLKVIKIDKWYIGFYRFHEYSFKGIAKTKEILKIKFSKDLRANGINYFHIWLMEIDVKL